MSRIYDVAITVSPSAPPGADRFALMLSWAAWGVSIAAVLGLLIVAGGMVLRHRRGESSEHGGALGLVLTGTIVATMAGPIVTALGLGG